MADLVSRKSGGSLAALITCQPRLLRDLEEMQVGVRIVDSPSISSQLNQVSVKFHLYDKIKKAQWEDPQMEKMQERTQRGELKRVLY